jgi:4-amino-4-deoxy-L-arabinose transferase-like glycosyltransferase
MSHRGQRQTFPWKVWIFRAVLATTLLVLLLGAVNHIDPVKEGLTGTHFARRGAALVPIRSVVDAPPSTERIAEAWDDAPPERFNATWVGGLLIVRSDAYTFATASDDGSHVYIDGRKVVDNGGSHAVEVRSGTVQLAAGVHSIFIDYANDGGGSHFELLWGRGSGPLERVPGWVLAARQVRAARLVPSIAVLGLLRGVEWLWVGTLVAAAGLVLSRGKTALTGALERAGAWPALGWILAGSLVLNLTGIWWGLPGHWVAIEVTPGFVIEGLGKRFSHGWYDAYPPLHFYLLSVAMSPMLLLRWLGRVNFGGPVTYSIALLSCRLLSVVMGAGTLIAVYLCGVRTFGRRAGLLAAGIFATVAPFLYYAKTANVDVPYIFWWALSMVFYLRVLERFERRDYLLFAATGTFAICTKDQAYGLYVLPPLVLIYEKWRANKRAHQPRPLWDALIDGNLAAGAITAVVLFVLCHNLAFNYVGFLDHLAFITGPGSVNYRAFAPTASGHLQLLGRTISLIRLSFGWPLFLAAISGLIVAASTARLRRMSVWLVVPAVSYYFGFIDVVLYNYDRFVLPICLVLAFFGGLAFDRLLTSGGKRQTWRILATAAAFGYTLLYAVSVDVLMAGDSRYDAQHWLAAHARRDDLIGHAFDPEYLPNFGRFRHGDIKSIEDLRKQRPVYYVVNADYARAVPRDSRPLGPLLDGLERGTLGYRLAYRFRRNLPWSWLPGGHGDLVGSRLETRVFSTLRNVNPTIEIFEREAPGGAR